MLNIVIPMAGNGQRFVDAGYPEPKPFIDVLGKPMVKRVIDNLIPRQPYRFILICRQEYAQRLEGLVEPGDVVLPLSEPTGGAAETLLTAAHYIDNDDQLMIANCDQLLDFDVNEFLAYPGDGAVAVFPSSNEHHSYVINDPITEIVEKEVVSKEAVSGVYVFKKGRDFMEAAAQVINEGIRVKGEFYISTAIQNLIDAGKELHSYRTNTAILGTPSELQLFLVARKVSL